MAVVVSMAHGHDAWYPVKTTRTAEGPGITGQYGASYYLSAVEKGGESARDPAVQVRVGLPARQHVPGDRRVPRESGRPVLLPPGTDHQDHTRARRPV
ncbi:MAG TPA: hypothetical protein VEH31_32525 [Streptosporangiaceae bacterium]|nr:hypothetical protein [Streptosporangiaceae bacterium]